MLSDSKLGHLMEEDLGMIVARPVRDYALAQEVILGAGGFWRNGPIDTRLFF